jgi:hypothetical protein
MAELKASDNHRDTEAQRKKKLQRAGSVPRSVSLCLCG